MFNLTNGPGLPHHLLTLIGDYAFFDVDDEPVTPVVAAPAPAVIDAPTVTGQATDAALLSFACFCF